MREMLQWWGHQSGHACLSDMSSDGDKSPAASPPRTRQPSPSPCGWSSGSDGGPPPPPRPPHRPPRRRAAQVAGQDLQLPGATHGPRGAGLPHPGVLPGLPLPGPLHLLDDRGVRGGGGGAALPAGDRDRALVQPGADREELVRGLPVPLPGILMLLLPATTRFLLGIYISISQALITITFILYLLQITRALWLLRSVIRSQWNLWSPLPIYV